MKNTDKEITATEHASLDKADKVKWVEVWQWRQGSSDWNDESEDIINQFTDYNEYEQLHFDANKGGKLDIYTRQTFRLKQKGE